MWCSFFICGLTTALGLEELVVDTSGNNLKKVKIKL